MKTRGKKTASSKSQSQSQSQADGTATTKHTLEPSEDNPPKLFVLPKDASPHARIVTLPHPATSQPHRYFVDPEQGFYEFTRIAAPKRACRSSLLAPESHESAVQSDLDEDGEGYVLQSPDFFVATPIDALFLLLPALWPTGSVEEWGTLHDRLFQTEDKLYAHLHAISQGDGGADLTQRMEERMRAVCDVIEMGDDTTYKLNIDKLAVVVYAKAERMVKAGLPASMEEHFIKRPLEAPELSMKREESDVSMPDAEQDTTAGAPSTTTTSASAQPIDMLTHLLRLRISLTYLCTAYIPPTLASHLQRTIASRNHPSFVDFTPLDTHLAHLAKLKAEAHALRSISDNISRKRGVLDDEEAVEKAEVKKRKKAEEEARKKSVSQGVKKLAKADTSGMKKMSSFFGKKG